MASVVLSTRTSTSRRYTMNPQRRRGQLVLKRQACSYDLLSGRFTCNEDTSSFSRPGAHTQWSIALSESTTSLDQVRTHAGTTPSLKTPGLALLSCFPCAVSRCRGAAKTSEAFMSPAVGKQLSVNIPSVVILLSCIISISVPCFCSRSSF